MSQKPMSDSNPVVIANDQSSIPVTVAAAATSIGKAEDAAHASGDVGVQMLAVRKATPVTLSGADGDYEPLQISVGALWTANAATDKTLLAERVISGGSEYETVAASAIDQVLGTTGATGDYLARLICVVATAATAATSIKDGAGSAISVLPNSPGGGVGTYVIELGLISTGGAWSVTTGAGVSVIACGNFT